MSDFASLDPLVARYKTKETSVPEKRRLRNEILTNITKELFGVIPLRLDTEVCISQGQFELILRHSSLTRKLLLTKHPWDYFTEARLRAAGVEVRGNLVRIANALWTAQLYFAEYGHDPRWKKASDEPKTIADLLRLGKKGLLNFKVGPSTIKAISAVLRQDRIIF